MEVELKLKAFRLAPDLWRDFDCTLLMYEDVDGIRQSLGEDGRYEIQRLSPLEKGTVTQALFERGQSMGPREYFEAGKPEAITVDL